MARSSVTRGTSANVSSRTPSAKLSSADFRFVSAWVQGVDVRDAWDRYQAHRGLGDLRRIRTTVRGILDQLAAVAMRHGDAHAAAVLRRDPARIKALERRSSGPLEVPVGHTMPALEQFATELANADFYSEAELVELLEERYGKVASLRPEGSDTASDGAGRRRAQRDTPELLAIKRKGRLVQRQLETLRCLEALAAAVPVAADHTTAWLDPNTCRHLRLAGVLTLGDLLLFIRLNGYRWYRKVTRIGETQAKRLTHWLRTHEQTLGAIASSALAPVSKMGSFVKAPPSAVGVVPIERLRMPVGLSGEGGSNRAAPER